MLTAEWGVGYAGGMAGVIGLIYSCLLTRGVEQIAKDTDYPGCTLLGAYGYRTQELVNLLVVGRATSNVFDGDRHLGDPGAADSTLLKGIHRATPVGYLALFEAYGSLEVGARLKHPTSGLGRLQRVAFFGPFCVRRGADYYGRELCAWRG